MAAAPNTVLQTAQTTATSKVFGGLTSGVGYGVTANVVGASGLSDGSEPVTQMTLKTRGQSAEVSGQKIGGRRLKPVSRRRSHNKRSGSALAPAFFAN